MILAIKANKEVKITKKQQTLFEAQGFTLIDTDVLPFEPDRDPVKAKATTKKAASDKPAVTKVKGTGA